MFEPAYDAYAPDVAMAGGVVRAVPLRAARLALRSGPAGGGVRAAHARADPEHAPQPDRQGVRARRAGGDRGAVPSPRRAGDQRRGLRRDPVRRRRARADRDAARHVSNGRSRSAAWARRSASPAGRSAGRSRPPPLTAAVRAVHQFVTFTNSAPFQEALADVLPAAAEQRLLRAAARRLRAPPRPAGAACCAARALQPLPIGGAYFLLTDVGKLGYASDADFCRRLVTEIGVAAIPTSVFYAASRSGARPSRASASRSATRRSSPPPPASPACARAPSPCAPLQRQEVGALGREAVQLAGVAN